MSNEKWVNLGDITPKFRLDGKKLQVQYPNEDWQDLADFSDVATALELRLNDETNAVEVMQSNGEWAVLLDLSKVGGGIKTVQTYRDLPDDAKEGDVCLVLEDDYGDWQTPTIENVARNEIKQLTFDNTLEAILSTLQPKLDMHSRLGAYMPIAVLKESEGLPYQVSLIYCKEQDVVAAALALVVVDSNDGYIIFNNSELVSSLIDISLPADLEANKWYSLSGNEDNINISAMAAAPVLDVDILATSINAVNEYTMGSRRIRVNANHLCKHTELLMSLVKARCSNNPAGIYVYDSEGWKPCGSEEQLAFFESDKTEDFYEAIWSLPFCNDTEPKTLYTRTRKSRDAETYKIDCYGYLNGRLFVNGSSACSSLCSVWLNDEISQDIIDTLDNTTITVNADNHSGNDSIVIACCNGMIFLFQNNQSTIAVYNSVAGAAFNPLVLESIFPNYYSTLPEYVFNETGWYICPRGAFFEKTDERFSLSALFEDMSLEYSLKSQESTIFWLEGITTTVPEVLTDEIYENQKSLYGLFINRKEAIYYNGFTSHVYGCPDKLYVFSGMNDTVVLTDVLIGEMYKNSHEHENIYDINKAAETWHEHKDFDYIESLADSNDYSKVCVIDDTLYIWHDGMDLGQNTHWMKAEGASPEIFNKMHTVGTPYPFWSWAGDRMFYDWGLYAPHITGFYKTENDADLVKSAMARQGQDDHDSIRKRQWLHLLKNHISEITDISNFFFGFNGITVPELDVSQVTEAISTFNGCFALRCIVNWDLSSLKSAEYMCYNCFNLKYFNPTEDYDCYVRLPAITHMRSMFYMCKNIESMCIDFGGETMLLSFMTDTFYGMSSLTKLNFVNGSIKVDGNCTPFGSEYTTTTNSKTGTTTSTHNYTSPLTVDSIVNFLNYLEDNTGGTQYTVTIPQTPYGLLNDEQKAIATNKNILLKGE